MIELRDALHSDQRSVREGALRVGAMTLADDALVGLLREGADDVLRNAGLEMLVQRGQRAVPILVELLSDRDSDVVLQAVIALDRIRDPRPADAIRDLLTHPNANVVQAAVAALGHLGGRSVVSDLLPFLSADGWLQIAAIEALGDLRAGEGLAALADLLPDAMLGGLAAEAIARIGGPQAFALLARHWLSTTGAGAQVLGLLAHVAEGADAPLDASRELRQALAVTLHHHDAAPRIGAARCVLALGGAHGIKALEVLAAPDAFGAEVPGCLRHRSDLVEHLLSAPLGARAKGWGLRLLARNPAAVPLRVVEQLADAWTPADDVALLAEVFVRLADAPLTRAATELYAKLPGEHRRVWVPVIAAYHPWLAGALADLHDLPHRARAVLEAVAAPPVGSIAMLVGMVDELRLEALEHFAHRPDVLDALPWIEWLARSPGLYAPLAVRLAEQAGLRLAQPEIRRLLERHAHPDLVRLVAELRDEESVPALERVALGGDATRVPYAIVALGRIGGARARTILREMIAGGGAWTRFAYRALAECRAPDDFPLFRDGMMHADWHVRLICVSVLGAARRPADVALIADATADPIDAVADRARRYLAR